MFCVRCNYDLRVCSSDRCPECGAHFDPTDVKSYKYWPVSRHHWIRLFLVALPVSWLLTTLILIPGNRPITTGLITIVVLFGVFSAIPIGLLVLFAYAWNQMRR